MIAGLNFAEQDPVRGKSVMITEKEAGIILSENPFSFYNDTSLPIFFSL